MKDAIIVVPGLFGGLASKYYTPLTKLLGSDQFLLFRAGADWNPNAIAADIKRIEGKKKVICFSCGAMIGNLLTEDKDTDVFYICPCLGREFLRGRLLHILSPALRILAFIFMGISKPFAQHRWYPLYGGTKLDNWFLSLYAISKQFSYIFDKTPSIKSVNGVIYSTGDRVINPTAVAKMFPRAIAAWTTDQKGPEHINLREDGEKFGSTTTSQNGNLSSDAKAYLNAFQSLIKRPL